jgi:hypothetical protein
VPSCVVHQYVEDLPDHAAGDFCCSYALASGHGQPPALLGERAVPAPFRFGHYVIERDRFGSCPLIGSSGRTWERTRKIWSAAGMIRAADRWCRVSISDLERHQLTLLRAQLGLDPPPADTTTARPTAAEALQHAQDLTAPRLGLHPASPTIPGRSW